MAYNVCTWSLNKIWKRAFWTRCEFPSDYVWQSQCTECEGNDWILMQPLNGTRTHTTRAVWICIETLYTEYTPLHTLRGKRPVSLKIKDSLQWREWVQKNPDPRDVSKLCSATQTIAFICYTPILLLWTIYFLQLVQCPVSPICRLQPFWFDEFLQFPNMISIYVYQLMNQCWKNCL